MEKIKVTKEQLKNLKKFYKKFEKIEAERDRHLFALEKKMAKELGIKLIVKKSKGEKEKELEDLKQLIMSIKDEIKGIVVGGIASSYQ